MKLKKAYERYIILTESNNFYLDNEEYLGNSYENVVYSILSGEIKAAPILCSRIFDTLSRHGWDKDIDQEIDSIIAVYEKIGFKVFSAARSFLKKFRKVNMSPGPAALMLLLL